MNWQAFNAWLAMILGYRRRGPIAGFQIMPPKISGSLFTARRIPPVILSIAKVGALCECGRSYPDPPSPIPYYPQPCFYGSHNDGGIDPEEDFEGKDPDEDEIAAEIDDCIKTYQTQRGKSLWLGSMLCWAADVQRKARRGFVFDASDSAWTDLRSHWIDPWALAGRHDWRFFPKGATGIPSYSHSIHQGLKEYLDQVMKGFRDADTRMVLDLSSKDPINFPRRLTAVLVDPIDLSQLCFDVLVKRPEKWAPFTPIGGGRKEYQGSGIIPFPFDISDDQVRERTGEMVGMWDSYWDEIDADREKWGEKGSAERVGKQFGACLATILLSVAGSKGYNITEAFDDDPFNLTGGMIDFSSFGDVLASLLNKVGSILEDADLGEYWQDVLGAAGTVLGAVLDNTIA